MSQADAMSTYIGYAYYEDTPGPFPVHDPSLDLLTDSNLAAAFDQLFVSPGAPDYWVVVVRNTSSCRSKFAVVTNPYARRAAARSHTTASMQRLARVR